ncbi:outer membrane protein [Halovulum sp. GXIMD14793]
MRKLQAIAAAATLLAAPVQAADWNGFYLGGQVGYSFGDTTGVSLPVEGALGGVHAGYNHDLGTTVIGAEIDYDIADIEVLGPVITLDQLAHVKLKLGYDGGRFLAYGTAGAAWANISGLGSSVDDFGYMVGVGLDYQVTDRITIGTEYNYNIFDDFNSSGDGIDLHTVQARMSFHF